MFDFIPIFLYTHIYYHVLFVIMLSICVHLLFTDIQDLKSVNLTNIFGHLVLVWVTLYMGLRPEAPQFGDSYFYAHSFRMEQLDLVHYQSSDWVFSRFLKFAAKSMTLNQFFLLIDIIYIVPCYIFSKKYFKNYWFYAFFMFIGSFSFFSYGTNGLRNGMATALFVLAMCFYRRKILVAAILFIAVGTHKSVLIPIAGLVISYFYRNTRYIFIAWLCLIPLSLLSGGLWESLFGGLIDVSRSEYLSQNTVVNHTGR